MLGFGGMLHRGYFFILALIATHAVATVFDGPTDVLNNSYDVIVVGGMAQLFQFVTKH